MKNELSIEGPHEFLQELVSVNSISKKGKKKSVR